MTDSSIDLRYIAESQPSICIPRVFNNIDKARILAVFDSLNIAKVHHIDIVERKNEKGEPFKRVYVHFEKWFWNEDAQAARRKLIMGKEIKIVYDTPWFWKVSANRSQPNERPPQQKTVRSFVPHIEFDDEPRTAKDHGDTLAKVTHNLQILQEPKPDDRRKQDDRRKPDDRRKHDIKCRPVDTSRNLATTHSVNVNTRHQQAGDNNALLNYGNQAVKLLKKNRTAEKAEAVKQGSYNIADLKIEEGEEVSDADKQLSTELYGDL
jgi:hypothetical protein